MNNKIVVLAGSQQQFKDWVRENIICITSKNDLPKLRMNYIDSVHSYGTYYEWFDKEVDNDILSRMVYND